MYPHTGGSEWPRLNVERRTLKYDSASRQDKYVVGLTATKLFDRLALDLGLASEVHVGLWAWHPY